MDLKIVMCHNYLPCEAAKQEYAQGRDWYVHIGTSSSLKRDAFDGWAKKHLTLDSECPQSMPELNFTLCELEALYAGSSLPEVKKADYVGLCHNRRLFNIVQVESCCRLL